MIRWNPGVNCGLWLGIVSCYGVINDNEGILMPDANEGKEVGGKAYRSSPHFLAFRQLANCSSKVAYPFERVERRRVPLQL